MNEQVTPIITGPRNGEQAKGRHSVNRLPVSPPPIRESRVTEIMKV